MKIQRFNKSLDGRYGPTDKILKGTLHMEFEVPKSDLGPYIEEYDDTETALAVYLQDSGIGNYIEYELVDYKGNKIEDEEFFDETNKYNL